MKPSKVRLNHVTFWPPFLILLASVIVSLINKDAFAAIMNGAYNWITHWFGWLFAAVALCFVIILFIIFCSPAGKIKFGGKEAKPKYTFIQWFAMSLCGGIAIGIVFWGVAEPITHLGEPALGITPFSEEAVMFSISTVYLHWSFTPYALYVIATIPIALAVYNYRQKLTISSGLYFLMGDKCHGTIGKIIDAVCLFALAGGIATSMGLGIMQITSGLSFLTGITPSVFIWSMVALFIIVAFSLSSSLGIDKGLKWLADQNLKLYSLVLVFVLIMGPTAYILNLGVEGGGEFITTFFQKSTYLGAASGEDWSRWWSIFYWAAWIAYAPVVGVFLTRLCYGRTVRQFLTVNLIAPAMFGIIWFTIFGGTAINMQLTGALDIFATLSELGTESAVFTFFSQFPFGTFLVGLFLVIIVISFITMADSMTSVAAIISTTGFQQEEGEPPLVLKIVWGLIMGSLAWVMICFAGIDGPRMLAVLASFPLLFLMIALALSALKGLFGDAEAPLWTKKEKKLKKDGEE
ncbi:MAG: BCCT family transporter [Bacillota bacterium]|nr:BCCT family transporter [Bacillota bacterium]